MTVAVIVTHNSDKVITDCLSSLQHEKRLQILVVDNASSDKTVSLIKSRFSKVNLVNLAKNIGFAGGNNVGIDEALKLNPNQVLILNPDTILDKKCLKNLLFHAETHVTPQILGSKIYTKNNRIWSVGGELDKKRWTAKLIGFAEKDAGQFDRVREVDFVSGTCMLIPRNVLENGLRFHEPFFLYYEDVEFCIKAKKRGFPSYVIPDAKIIHKETSEGVKLVHPPGGIDWHPFSFVKNYYLARNHLLFVERNAPFLVRFREMLRMPKTLWEHYVHKDTQAQCGIKDYFLRKFYAKAD